MKQLPEQTTAIVPHERPEQGSGSPDGAFAAEASTLRGLLAEYEARADKLLDWQPERKLEPGETKIDAVFRMVERLKGDLTEERRRNLGLRQEASTLREKVEPLRRRVVQLEGLVQSSTERVVDMIAPGNPQSAANAKAMSNELRGAIADLEHAQGVLDGLGIGRYHPDTGRTLSLVDRIEFFMRRATQVGEVVQGEGEALDGDGDVVIVEMPSEGGDP